MAVRNNHWYNINSQRNYPLDDTASCESDAGTRLPNGIIVDLRLRWASTYGTYAFVSSVAATDHIVTVMIEVSSTVDNSSADAMLIAGISVPREELTYGRTYVLNTFADNVAGFISLGNSTKNFSGLFSTPAQSLITARAGRYDRVPPVSSLGINNAITTLNGVVNFEAIPPLKIERKSDLVIRTESDQDKVFDEAIVFSLINESDTQGEEFPIPGLDAGIENVFKDFAGQCGQRVISRTCGSPQPIETINGVVPDCDGVIKLKFKGCALVGKNDDDCGVVIDCATGLSNTCDPHPLPALDTGKLPSEDPPKLVPPTPLPEPPTPEPTSISETITTVFSLPFCQPFEEGTGIPVGFSTTSGYFAWAPGYDSPAEDYCCFYVDHSSCSLSFSDSLSLYNSYSRLDSQSESTSESGSLVSYYETKNRDRYQSFDGESFWLNNQRKFWRNQSYGSNGPLAESLKNISLYTADVQSLFRKLSTDFLILDGTFTAQHNAGVLINYKIDSNSLPSYLLAYVDVDNSVFSINRFNGISLQTIATTSLPALQTNKWYRVEFSADVASSFTGVSLTATLRNMSDGGSPTSLSGTIASNVYGTDSGLTGIYANKSRSLFSYYRIDRV